jgi:hypothetical protein
VLSRPLHIRNKCPIFGPCVTTPKLDYLHVNKPSFWLLMARIRSRKSVARHFTPPIELSLSEGHAKTPQRSAVIAAKAYAQELGIPIPQSLVFKVTGVAPRD